MTKKLRKNSSFVIFELYQQYITQKKAFFMKNSNLVIKNMLGSKKFQKRDFFLGFYEKLYGPVGSNNIFFKDGKKISKITFSGHVKRVEMKSHQI